ncbi:MAG: MgtC/SapB family protein [Hyphomicrobium sp.]
MDTITLFQRLSVALAVGLLIGLERGWQARGDADGERAAGLRTHALAGLLGGVWGAIAEGAGDAGLVALAFAFAAFTGVITLFRYREAVRDHTMGATTVLAAMLAFALGAFAVLGDMQAAAAGGVAVTILLTLKSQLHGWLQRLTWIEFRSGLVLLAMTFVLLPLLPNRTVDPWQTVNPFEIWLMTIMIAVISFAGYVAIKALGAERGVLMTGVAGGLASSTAVTVNLSDLARQNPEQSATLVSGILMANATMMARVLVVAGLINAAVFERLMVPGVLAGAALVVAAMFLLRQGRHVAAPERTLVLQNPFELATVLKFGAMLTVIFMAANIATRTVGDAGAYALAAVSGVADVDAITLSMSRLGFGALGPDTAARAIALAVGVNTIAKVVLGWMTGGAGVGRRLAVASALAMGAGGVGVIALRAAG